VLVPIGGPSMISPVLTTNELPLISTAKWSMPRGAGPPPCSPP
jgi:hypothetical protein